MSGLVELVGLVGLVQLIRIVKLVLLVGLAGLGGSRLDIHQDNPLKNVQAFNKLKYK